MNYSPQVTKSILSNFYVDDWLVSTPTVSEATQLTQDVIQMLKEGEFHLTKFISTDKVVMKSIPQTEWSKGLINIDLDKHELPQDRVLGIRWNIEDDTFYFKLDLIKKPYTRRGIISVISSIYDPLGFASPVVIIGKIIFQDLTRLQLKWDESIPTHIQERWIEWLNELPMLEAMRIPRCLKPQIYNTCATTIQLHHFSDASEAAYGIITYIRIIDPSDHIHVTLLLSKPRLAPLKAMTKARLELIAAVLAARMDATLRSELDLNIQDSFFWCDSQLVIQYIKNEKKRFHVFVANRVAAIQQASKPEQWRHIPGDMNPADDVTRGMRPKQFVQSRWLNGPRFLSTPQKDWSFSTVPEDLPSDDPEIRKEVTSHHVQMADSPIKDLICRTFSFHKLKRMIGWLLLLKDILLAKVRGTSLSPKSLSVDILERAEHDIVRHVQTECLNEEYTALISGKTVKRSSPIYKLSPIVNKKPF